MVLELILNSNVITAVLLILFLYLIKQALSGPSNVPPGPTGLPIVGLIPRVRKKPLHEVYREWRKQYGDIFSMKLGPKLFVVIIGDDNVRDAFLKRGDVFSDRPDIYFIKTILKEKGKFDQLF